MKKIKNSLIVILMQFFLFAYVNGQNRTDELLLETCGVLSAQGIYLTFTSIGSATDGSATGTYEDDFSVELLSEYVFLSEVAKNQLSAVLTSGILAEEDVSYLASLITGYGYLISEANAYINFIQTGKYQYIEEYNEYRAYAWNLISELLDFEE